MSVFKCIESLEENSKEVFLEVSLILLRLVDNVIMYPSNPKYRKLRLENKLISSVIIPSIGAMECLFEMGFQEGDDALLLPPENTSMEKLNKFRAEISKIRDKYLEKEKTSDNNARSSHTETVISERQSTPQPEASAQSLPAAPSPSSSSPNAFLSKLHMFSSVVLQYETPSTKQKALSIIPLAEIGEKVQSCMRQIQKQASKNDQPINEASLQERFFFTELMAWFKNDFFQWMNSPKCPMCSCDSKFVEMSSNPQELVETNRVEVYKCVKCTNRLLFPRLNSVPRLLETRTGRCGEWANVFTAMCCALGWDARYVLDETDHVWTEVYFKSEKRWVHCDPCECALDKPLLYEKGWRKQLSYVIAFSCEDAQDVTWRYSADHKAVMARRKLCSEQELVHQIQEINKLRQAKLSALRKKVLAKRTVLELIQLMNPACESEGDEEGRLSGSLAWRLVRGETQTESPVQSYFWTPNSQELEAKKMAISYCSAKDEYRRDLTGEVRKGWYSGVLDAGNIFRKSELDWNTVYLCRTENSSEGRIAWQFDVSNSGLTIDEVEVKFVSTTFQSGKIIWLLCSGDKCVPVKNGELKTSEFRGSTSVMLKASLSGGEGLVGWQHAQLFRQSLTANDNAFHVCVTLCKE